MMSIVAQSVVSDPVSIFAPLGTAGIVCVVLFLWQRETAKRLSQKEAVLDQLNPLLTRVLDVLVASNVSHEASAIAQQSAAEALRRVPSEETFTRIKVALERVERITGQGGT